MKSLESRLFSVTFVYNVGLVEKLTKIACTSASEKRVRCVKWLIFKMMKDVVKKNVQNYLNLLHTIENYPKDNVPSVDNLIEDCYEIFDTCVHKYRYGEGYNFYFYFNKAMSRNFFRRYTKERKRMFIEIRQNEDYDYEGRLSTANLGGAETIDLVIDLLDFSELEKKIAYSKFNGQKTVDFLKQNPEVTNAVYSRTLQSIKDKLSQAYDL